RAVHTRIRIRHTDLDEVAARFGQRPHGIERRRDIGVPGGQISDQRGTVLTVARTEKRRQSALLALLDRHERSLSALLSSKPNHFAAVSTSLSPRPDRFTTMIAPLPISTPSLSAPATACADSIAGMMPSVRHSRRNASIASVSVIGRYSARPLSRSHACSGPTPG